MGSAINAELSRAGLGRERSKRVSIAQMGRARWLVALCIYVFLLGFWTHKITGSPISSDDIATVVPAVNLQHHGVIALKTHDLPTMYREPLPIFTTTILVALVDGIYGPAQTDEYLAGKRARLLKLQNLFWLTLLCAGSFYVAFRLTASFPLALVAAVLSHLLFVLSGSRGAALDSLYTEIPAAALLVLASWSFAAGLTRPNVRTLALAGALFGCAALVKASFLYVAVGLVLLIAIRTLLQGRAVSWRTGTAQLLAFPLVFALVIAPWVYRNWVQFETIGIAERGGLALYFRALYNDVNAAEYKGLFYAWAPTPLAPIVGRMLDISPADFESGGPLFRLNRETTWERINVAAERAGRPELATSLVGQARAERVKARTAFAAAGYGQRTDVAADNYLRDRALEKMRANPSGALAMTVPALWRGGWLLVPLLMLTTLHAVARRRPELIAFCVPAAVLAAFYGLLTVFERRFGVPPTTIAILAVCIAVHGELTHRAVHAR